MTIHANANYTVGSDIMAGRRKTKNHVTCLCLRDSQIAFSEIHQIPLARNRTFEREAKREMGCAGLPREVRLHGQRCISQVVRWSGLEMRNPVGVRVRSNTKTFLEIIMMICENMFLEKCKVLTQRFETKWFSKKSWESDRFSSKSERKLRNCCWSIIKKRKYRLVKWFVAEFLQLECCKSWNPK